MKKLKLFAALFFISLISNAQTSTVKLNPDLTSDYVVYNVPDLKASDLYTKTLNWISSTFPNGDKAIVSKLENEMIKLKSQSRFAEKKVGKSTSANVVEYTIEIQFQDAKYRMKFIQDEFNVDSGGQILKVEEKDKILKFFKVDYEKIIQDLMDSSFKYITTPKEKW